MSRFNPHSRIGKAVIAEALLGALLEGETDPVRRERIGKVMGVLPKETPRPATKCLLPTCRGLTTHNGGYCSADHCQQHRDELRHKEESHVP